MKIEDFVQYVSKFTYDFDYPKLEPRDIVVIDGNGSKQTPFRARVYTDSVLSGFDDSTFILNTPIFKIYLCISEGEFKTYAKIRVTPDESDFK